MGRPKSYERNKVLGQALTRFWQQGYRATSLSDLTETTGLNKKSLYAEFGDKEALFRAALELYGHDRSELAKEYLTRQPAGAQNIRHFFHALCEQTENRGCLFTVTLNERSASDESHAYVNGALSKLEGLFYANLITDNNGWPKAQRRRVARHLIVFMQGLMTIARTGVEESELKRLVDVGLNAALRRGDRPGSPAL